MQVKRLLFFTHRWLGVALALLMLLWFASGLVIVYAPNTVQSRDDQLAHGELLAPQADWLPLGSAWAARWGGGDEAAPQRIASARLLRQLDEPLWLVEDVQGERHLISALDGSARQADATRAVALTRAWLGDPHAAVAHLETFTHDATVRNLEALRPFHRVAVNDGRGTEITLSARTGEVVRVADAVDRGLFWAGNWLHLFRPLDSVGWGEARRDVLLWVSGFTVVATLTGLIVGWLRWRPGFGRQPQYSGRRAHPYRAFWFSWHFWSGLIGGIVALLWIGSGFFNNNPWQLFSAANANRGELGRFIGKEVPAVMLQWQPGLSAAVPADTVELRWQRLGREATLLAANAEGRLQALPVAAPAFAADTVRAAVLRAAGDAGIASQTLQTEYDSYYYPRHGRAASDRPLPVVRVELADAGNTRYYVDPREGRLLLRQDDSRRTYRWVFSALHHWDFGWLYARPLWDGWMIVWIGFGLVMSLTSVVLGWKRLRASFRRQQSRARAPSPAAGRQTDQLATSRQAG